MKSPATLVNVTRQHDAYTANGALTHSTSLNPVVDMFFLAGASRNMPEADIVRIFSAAYGANPELAAKCLFWARDVRGGAGERRFFHTCMKWLMQNHAEEADQLMIHIPEYGYWKDIITLEEPNTNNLDWMYRKLTERPQDAGLLAKWFPRHGKWFKAMHKHARITPKELRKLLVSLTRVVETKMCNRDWNGINYSQVPSQAFQRYKKAFERNDQGRFTMFLTAVAEGKAKVNSNTLYPYQLYMDMLNRTNPDAIRAQWAALPDFVGEGSFLPLSDVSGSMETGYGAGKLTPMMISVSLGLYLSERNKGVFKDAVITFHERPEMLFLQGDVIDRFHQLKNSEWGGNTNLQSVFNLILDKARQHNLQQADIPENLLIISDMEFDQVEAGYGRPRTNLEAIQEQWTKAGYQMPKIIFWNVNGRMGNSPATCDEEGIALVSGASPSIVKNVLEGKQITPASLMLDTLLSERYERIIV